MTMNYVYIRIEYVSTASPDHRHTQCQRVVIPCRVICVNLPRAEGVVLDGGGVRSFEGDGNGDVY